MRERVAMTFDEVAQVRFECRVRGTRRAGAGVVVGQRGALAGIHQREDAILQRREPQQRPALRRRRVREQRGPVGTSRRGGAQRLVQRIVAHRRAREEGELLLQRGDHGGVLVGSHCNEIHE